MSDVYVLFARKDDWYESEVIQAVFSSFENLIQYVDDNFEKWGSDEYEFREERLLTAFLSAFYIKGKSHGDRYYLSYYKGPVL